MSITPAPGTPLSGAPRLEARWIRPGSLDARTVEWFDRFPASSESRVDNYLSNPDISGLSVKIRGGHTLEVKMHRGRRGELAVPERARGFLESWQRWSFPSQATSWGNPDAAGWTSVSKLRRTTFVHSNGRTSAGGAEPGREIGCAVELTEVETAGRRWWTIGFEATGPEDDLPGLVQAAAAIVFDEPIPGQFEFHAHESSSYADWLRTQAERDRRQGREPADGRERPHESPD